MTMMKPVAAKAIYMGKLSHGADLIDELTAICRQRNIRLARIEAIGAVQQACLAYYDQQKQVYQYFNLDRHLEITKLTGNVSEKDGAPMVHAHITLADEAGRAYGGHLAQGTKVFACEFILEVFDGPSFERGHDAITGLPLWKEDE